jgi:hypothetical protein
MRALRAWAVRRRDAHDHRRLGDQRIGDLLARMRHDGCSGWPAFVELLTGIPGASRPVRRLVLIEREGW